MKKANLAIVGAGSRGYGYARYALENPKQARVVAVAEPRPEYRRKIVDEHHIPEENVFSDWREMAAVQRLADGVVVATQDDMHVGPAIAFAHKGYHMLLEKPMAPDEEGCRSIADAVARNDIIFATGFVLRYTPYTRAIKKLIDSGRIGEVVGIQQLEPVGFWHQAHSFVRGNWRSQAESSNMLLAKCSHDLDWLDHIMGSHCRAVSSFGSLKHFRRDQAPAGAAERCLDCPVESDCPYSAKRIYGRFLDQGSTGWPLDVLAAEVTPDNIADALRTGPYGRCVYACDNDVVDHQVVALEYANGGTATLTMMAFTKATARKTEIFGTRGHISGDGSVLQVYDFLGDTTEKIDTRASEQSVAGRHGGGDEGLMRDFVAAVAHGDQSFISGDCGDSLRSHLTVFAAERARLERRVVALD